MKKKIIAILILVVLLATFASGCNIISENKERKANEILATVSADGITLDITRNEYLAYANYMINQYYQYGMQPDLESLMPEILDYMVDQKYLVIKAMTYLKKIPARKELMASNLPNVSENTPEGVLTFAERYHAIKVVNESFQEEIDKYIEEYELEKKNMDISKAREDIATYLNDGYIIANGDVEIAKDSFKAEYLQNEKLEMAKVKIAITLTKADNQAKTVIMPVKENMYDEDAKFSTELDDNEVRDKVVEREVVLIYEEPITVDGEVDYKVHKTEPFKYRVVAPRGTEKKEEKISVDVGTIVDRYKPIKDISSENKAEYFDYNLSSTTAIKEAYRQFRQAKKDMLINFEKDGLQYYYDNQFESAVLEALKHEIAKATDVSKLTEEYVANEYRVLFERQKEEYDVLSTDKAKLDKFVKNLGDQVLNLENMYYVPTEAIANEGYSLQEFFCVTHILFMFDKQQSQAIEEESGDRDAEELKALRELAAQFIKTSRSNPEYDPEYEGDCEDYSGDGICPKLAFDPDHLEEDLFMGEGNVFDAISNALKQAEPKDRLRLFKDFMALYNDDGGAMQSDTGYIMAPKGVADIWQQEFMDLAREMFAQDVGVGNPFIIVDGEEKLAYCISSFGLHIMTISFMPFEQGAVSAEGMFAIDKPIDIKGTTHLEKLVQNLAQELRNKEYSKFAEDKKAEKDDFSINQKKFNKLLKELGVK